MVKKRKLKISVFKDKTPLFFALELILVTLGVILYFNFPLIYPLMILVPMSYLLIDYTTKLFIFN